MSILTFKNISLGFFRLLERRHCFLLGNQRDDDTFCDLRISQEKIERISEQTENGRENFRRLFRVYALRCLFQNLRYSRGVSTWLVI